MDVIDFYRDEYEKKQFERKMLFARVQEKYKIQKALYPGSFVHITPSFYIPHVVYVDSFKKAEHFFTEKESVFHFIQENKVYSDIPKFIFIFADYGEKLALDDEFFDLLISQWAGPISHTCKRYLRHGGILLANNSHADAGIAFLDPDYELVAVGNHTQEKFTISEKNLHQYFIPKQNKAVSITDLLESGKGIGYTKTAAYYLFRKT